MKTTKRLIALFLSLAMTLSFSVTAFAAGPEDGVASFFADPEAAREALNELSNSEAVEIESLMMFDGTPVRIETRELEVSDDLTIVNTRTFSVSSTYVYSIEDRYGLFYAGIQGWGGYLVASYTYFHPVIDNPNQMQTQFLSANGSTEDILENVYKVTATHGSFDSGSDYNVKASVEFDVKSRFDGTTFWSPAVPYTNTCNIDKYGGAHFSW